MRYEFSKTQIQKVFLKFAIKNPKNPETERKKTQHFEIISEPAAMISVFYVISVENHARVASRVDKMDKPFVYLPLL